MRLRNPLPSLLLLTAAFCALPALASSAPTDPRAGDSRFDQQGATSDAAAEAIWARAEARRRARQLPEAIAEFTAYLKVRPNAADALALRGVCFAQLSNFDAAIRDFTAALAIDPNEETYFNRAQAYRQSGNLREALADLDATDKLRPRYVPTLRSRCTVRRQLSDPNAFDDCDAMIRLEPNDPRHVWYRGNELFSAERYREAISDYIVVLRADPTHQDALLNAGASHIKLGQYEVALGYLDRLLRTAPGHATGHVNRGAALIELKRWEEGLEAFDRALVIEPMNDKARMGRATALKFLPAAGRADQPSGPAEGPYSGEWTFSGHQRLIGFVRIELTFTAGRTFELRRYEEERSRGSLKLASTASIQYAVAADGSLVVGNGASPYYTVTRLNDRLTMAFVGRVGPARPTTRSVAIAWDIVGPTSVDFVRKTQ